MPFIIKPTTGFFSMGVYKVSAIEKWQQVKKALRDETSSVEALYPKEILDTTMFIIEQCVEGLRRGTSTHLTMIYCSPGLNIPLNCEKLIARRILFLAFCSPKHHRRILVS